MRGFAHSALNVGKALLLYGGLAGGLYALGWWIGGVRLGSVFLVVGLLMVATMYWYGPRVILASLGARELTLAEAPALHSTAERFAMAAGVEPASLSPPRIRGPADHAADYERQRGAARHLAGRSVRGLRAA